MINKKHLRMIVCLVMQSSLLQSMNGFAAYLPQPMIASKINELWDDESLSESQRVAKLKLMFHTAQTKLLTKFYADTVNQKDGVSVNLLEDAVNQQESPALFKLLLSFKANPSISFNAKGSITSRVTTFKRADEYIKALEDQKIIDIIEPELDLALLGTDEAVIAVRLAALMKEKNISAQHMYAVLDELVIRKANEFETLDNVSIALQEKLAGREYKKKRAQDKKTFRADLAEKQVAYSEPETSTQENLSASSSSSLTSSGLFLGGATCIALGFGGKYLLDMLTEAK